MSIFILAMVQHPHVLAKAQEEMDSVIGRGRLPTFEDRPHLPYTEALMKESLRWAAPVPLSKQPDDWFCGLKVTNDCSRSAP
jgi:cytochrome P450